MKPGDKVFIKWNRPSVMEELEVKRVGSKYFYVERHGREVPFHLEKMIERAEYNPSRAYASMEDFEKEAEANSLYSSIHSFFERRYSRGNMNLDDLISIKEIISKYETRR